MAALEFGRYRVLGELGRGAMAVVYLAEDTQLERRVAVKVLTEQYANDAMFRERFRREGRILARAQHDSIVPIFDSGEANGLPYLVMKLMPGGTLADRVAHGPMDPQRALPILARMASALDAAHAAGVIHRDLKPANVLFDERDLAYVGDFGVGRMDGVASGVTQPGTVIGTAQYMSPEQIQGGDPSRASDVYSFAAMTFETLTGQPPFSGHDVWAVMRQHLEAPPPRPSEGRPWLAFADGPLLAGLAKRPEQRPPTATALVDMLIRAQAANAASPRLSPVPAPPPRGSTMPAATPPPVVKAPSRKQSAWRGPVALAAVGAAVAGVLVSVVIASFLDDDETPAESGATSTATNTPDDDDDDPTATPTGAGEEPTPTPTPRDPTNGATFLRESFDDPSRSTVGAFVDQYGTGVVANGELQLTDIADDGRLVWYRWDTGKSDISIKMRAFADVGLITMACRDDNRYQVRASVESREGSFKTSIYDEQSESFSTYTDWTETPLIPVDAKTTLELICRADLMEFVINGTTVASHTIAGTSGTLAWIAADGGVGSNVFIDDIVITTLN